MAFMTLKNVKILFLTSLFMTIGSPMNAFTNDNNVEHIRYAKEIISSFTQECEKNHQVVCIATGGELSHNVKKIKLSFIAYRKGSIEEARKIEVAIIEDLLKKVNAHEKIRPFLDEYPFQPHNLSISLAFRKRDDSCYTDGSVVLTLIGKGKLLYCREDPKTGKLEDIMEEPYEEALKIVFGDAFERSSNLPPPPF